MMLLTMATNVMVPDSQYTYSILYLKYMAQSDVGSCSAYVLGLKVSFMYGLGAVEPGFFDGLVSLVLSACGHDVSMCMVVGSSSESPWLTCRRKKSLRKEPEQQGSRRDHGSSPTVGLFEVDFQTPLKKRDDPLQACRPVQCHLLHMSVSAFVL